VIVERVEPSVSAAGRAISQFFEVFVAVYVISYIAGPLAREIDKLIPNRSVAMTTIAAAVGAIFMYIVDWLRADLQLKISSRVNLTDKLAPFFGHRLDNTFRVLRG